MAGKHYDIVCLLFRRVADAQVGMGSVIIDNHINHVTAWVNHRDIHGFGAIIQGSAPSVSCASYVHQLNVLQMWAEMRGWRALNSARVFALFRGRN